MKKRKIEEDKEGEKKKARESRARCTKHFRKQKFLRPFLCPKAAGVFDELKKKRAAKLAHRGRPFNFFRYNTVDGAAFASRIDFFKRRKRKK